MTTDKKRCDSEKSDDGLLEMLEESYCEDTVNDRVIRTWHLLAIRTGMRTAAALERIADNLDNIAEAAAAADEAGEV